MKSGLYVTPGARSATCVAAARASSFALPVTKVSKVKAGFNRDTSRLLAFAAAGASGAGGAARSTDSLSARSSLTSSVRLKWAWASSSTRRANLSRIHCCTKRLGAISVTESASTLHFNGLIQVRNCWGGSSFSNEARQRRQKVIHRYRLGVGIRASPRQRDDSKFYLFRGWLSTGWSVFPNAFHACEAAALRAPGALAKLAPRVDIRRR